MSFFIDDPLDPFDVAAWESRIEDLMRRRDTIDATTYDLTLGSLQSGLAMALRGPSEAPPQFGSLRAKLRAINSAK